MKRPAKHFLVFLVLFCGTYYSVYYALFNIKYNRGPLILQWQSELEIYRDIYGRALKEFDRNQKYDLIFLGSSHCYRCIDPAIFSEHRINSFNLGSSSQTPLNSYCILKKYISNARQVLLEVYPVVSNLSGAESFISMLSAAPDYSLLADMAWKLNDLRCYNLFSIKPYLDRASASSPYTMDGKVYRERGYVASPDSAGALAAYENYVLQPETVDRQLKYIQKIIDLCKEEKVGIALVYAPVPKEMRIENEAYFISRLNEIATSENVFFFNYGRNHNLNSRFNFCDDDHLNQSGVQLFNERLIGEMQARHFMN